MTTQTQTINATTGNFLHKLTKATRKQIIGVFLVFVGVVVLYQAGNSLDSSTRSILTFEAGDVEDVPHIVVHTLTFLSLTGILFVVSGIGAFVEHQSFRRIGMSLLILSAILVPPALLVAASSGGRTNATTMLTESLRLATPIAIGAMAGIWCERSGVINIAIEGMMLFAAGFGFAALFFLRGAMPDNQALFIAVLVAVGVGGLAALLHAWLSITFRTDQIISGTVLNIMAVGVTSFVRREYLASTEAGSITLPRVSIPILKEIPILGDTLFNSQPIFYLMFVIILLTQVMLFYTRWGLRVRAVGEHPSAADTLGIDVNRTRWVNVFVAGLIAGLAGAWFSLEATGRFNDSMTGGAGFIALAAMIFGKWTPFGAFGAALLFGFSNALGTRLQIEDVGMPSQFLQMVPYIVTLVVLAGFIGHAFPPKAIGQPYVKEGQ
jgi:general nucleoside transport system permease protein